LEAVLFGLAAPVN